jgi:hypothetical protein
MIFVTHGNNKKEELIIEFETLRYDLIIFYALYFFLLKLNKEMKIKKFRIFKPENERIFCFINPHLV